MTAYSRSVCLAHASTSRQSHTGPMARRQRGSGSRPRLFQTCAVLCCTPSRSAISASETGSALLAGKSGAVAIGVTLRSGTHIRVGMGSGDPLQLLDELFDHAVSVPERGTESSPTTTDYGAPDHARSTTHNGRP